MARNRWIELTESNPGHSAWYIERFRSMAAAGDDLEGEARFVDAMVPRRSRILDAGCGPGRVGGYLARVGHDVVGVDIDPILIDVAKQEHPGPTWLVADLAEFDLPAIGVKQPFDAIVCAGNVVTFLDPATRRPVFANLAKHLRPDGCIVTGFGSGRDYTLPSRGESEFVQRAQERRDRRWSDSCVDDEIEILADPTRRSICLQAVEHHHLPTDHGPVDLVSIGQISEHRPQLIMQLAKNGERQRFDVDDRNHAPVIRSARSWAALIERSSHASSTDSTL